MPPRQNPDDPANLLPLQPAEFHILLALHDDDRHGYGIMQAVAERTEGRTKLNPGTLYTTLQRLTERGLITEWTPRERQGGHSDRRRSYRITSLGRRVARMEFERLGDLVNLGRAAGLLRTRQ